MPILLNQLASLIHLDDLKFSPSFKVSELKQKLIDTYIFVNNQLVEVLGLNGDVLHIAYDRDNEKTNMISINSTSDYNLKVFTPPTGVYLFQGWPFYMSKSVKKIYKKSFYPDSIHLQPVIDNFPSRLTIDYHQLAGQKPLTFYQIGSNIYYKQLCIGQVRYGVPMPISPFKEDLREHIDFGTIKIQ